MSNAIVYTYRELFVCWASKREPDGSIGDDFHDHEHDRDIPCDWGWICNGHDREECSSRVDTVPCPTHAPATPAGLRLVGCDAEPRHWLYAHDRDDYGHGCPMCWSDKLTKDLTAFRATLCHHHWWRRAESLRWIPRALKRLGLISGYGYQWGDGCVGCWTAAKK